MPIITTNIATYLEVPEHRCRVRRINEQEFIREALSRAKEKNKPSIRVAHGGGVANKYSYPANTEALTVVAFPNGSFWARVTKIPANKVTLSGVLYANTRLRGLFDDRFGSPKQEECRKKVIELAKAELASIK
jgi:hypothetical protein